MTALAKAADHQRMPVGGPTAEVDVVHPRRRIDVIVEFLDVLTVVTFGAGEPEKSLLLNRIFSIPKRERETKAALPITDAE